MLLNTQNHISLNNMEELKIYLGPKIKELIIIDIISKNKFSDLSRSQLEKIFNCKINLCSSEKICDPIKFKIMWKNFILKELYFFKIKNLDFQF